MRELRGLWCRLGLSLETGKIAGYLVLSKLLVGMAWCMFHLSVYKAADARVDNGDWAFWRDSWLGWRTCMERAKATQNGCRLAWTAHRRFLWCVRWVPLRVLPLVLEQARRSMRTNEETHG